MRDVAPSEVISDMKEAASSPERLECFPLFVDLFRILNVFEELKRINIRESRVKTTLTATL